MPPRVEDIERVKSVLSERRIERIDEVVSSRINGVAVLLEHLYDHGNEVAIMRTCEGLGVQRVDLVPLAGKFKPAKKVGQGAEKWLTVNCHDSSADAVKSLKSDGYRIVVTDLSAEKSLDELPLDFPVALVIGSELNGISQEMRRLSDDQVKIPMMGLTQSLNVSCAAAIFLFTLVSRYRHKIGGNSDLSPEEMEALKAHFYRRSAVGFGLLETEERF